MCSSEPQPLNNGYIGLVIPKNSSVLQKTLNQSLIGANLPKAQSSTVNSMVMGEYNNNAILTPNSGVSATINTNQSLENSIVTNDDGTTTVTTYSVKMKVEVTAIDMKVVGPVDFSQSQKQEAAISNAKTESGAADLTYSTKGFTISVSGSVSNTNTLTNVSGSTNNIRPTTTEFQGQMVFRVTSTVTATSTTFRIDNTFSMPGAPSTTVTQLGTTTSVYSSTLVSAPDSNVNVSATRIGTFK